jgi:hypothetical protein
VPLAADATSANSMVPVATINVANAPMNALPNVDVRMMTSFLLNRRPLPAGCIYAGRHQRRRA